MALALKIREATRNTRLDAIDTDVGATATLEIRTGAPPTGPGDADSGTLLATITLPNPAFAAAASGQMAKSGTWSVAASGAGVAGHFRIKAAGTTVIVQGTAGETADTPDLVLDNSDIASGQTVTVSAFTLTDGNG